MVLYIKARFESFIQNKARRKELVTLVEVHNCLFTQKQPTILFQTDIDDYRPLGKFAISQVD
jgi:hypothetical protein